MPPDEHTNITAWRADTEFPVDFSDALSRWTAAAHAVLAETAKLYGAFITQAELAARVQADTGIKAGGPVRLWIDDLLGGVTLACAEAGEPPLAALCVRLDQSVGDAYVHVLEVAGLPKPDDLDTHAAFARFQCYEHFGAAIPAGAGPVLTPRVAEKRASQRPGRAPKPAKAAPSRRVVKAKAPAVPKTAESVGSARAKAASGSARAKAARPEEPKPKLCPNCFTVLSTTGVCGFCS
ncbi:hypothetical protein P0W64_13200 [Tsukamurella sp. 8F]|uniref:hypothetical protein n=1 Tax=unclassified Tsukamurella TaxID=2633480 RepID=UPI0023B8D8BE|nr:MULTISPECIES: hypothetical protein [unclassified Tsukamurella]MDF0530450.1 hypothetical protein [Tsukamurella sp. 8J]MDF0587729.1 hypothetical protein [Tsukamurella sp. 8F]